MTALDASQCCLACVCVCECVLRMSLHFVQFIYISTLPLCIAMRKVDNLAESVLTSHTHTQTHRHKHAHKDIGTASRMSFHCTPTFNKPLKTHKRRTSRFPVHSSQFSLEFSVFSFQFAVQPFIAFCFLLLLLHCCSCSCSCRCCVVFNETHFFALVLAFESRLLPAFL